VEESVISKHFDETEISNQVSNDLPNSKVCQWREPASCRMRWLVILSSKVPNLPIGSYWSEHVNPQGLRPSVRVAETDREMEGGIWVLM